MNWMLSYQQWIYFCPPTKLREDNVLIVVCHSVRKGVDHIKDRWGTFLPSGISYPLGYPTPGHTHQPSGHTHPCYWHLVGDHCRPVQTCSFEDLPPHPPRLLEATSSGGNWNWNRCSFQAGGMYSIGMLSWYSYFNWRQNLLRYGLFTLENTDSDIGLDSDLKPDAYNVLWRTCPPCIELDWIHIHPHLLLYPHLT